MKPIELEWRGTSRSAWRLFIPISIVSIISLTAYQLPESTTTLTEWSPSTLQSWYNQNWVQTKWSTPTSQSQSAHHRKPAMGSPPYGPYGLRDDLFLFAIDNVEDGKVTLLGRETWKDNVNNENKVIWPLEEEGAIWCRGSDDEDWSEATLRHGVVDPHETALVLECQASGETIDLELRDLSMNKTITVPLTSIRPKMEKARPRVAVMTMISGWKANVPLWIEYNLMHGVEEIYIYDNSGSHQWSHLDEGIRQYVNDGRVTIVPWHKSIVQQWCDDSWGCQQILAENHAVRTLDGYAEWVLFSDIDEFIYSNSPNSKGTFQYIDLLDSMLQNDAELEVVNVRNCFAGYLETPEVFHTGPMGWIDRFPTKVIRSDRFREEHDRSKMFLRPEWTNVISVHVVTSGNGTEATFDPEHQPWLMHLSDHPVDTGYAVEIDTSDISRAIDDRLRKAYNYSGQ